MTVKLSEASTALTTQIGQILIEIRAPGIFLSAFPYIKELQ